MAYPTIPPKTEDIDVMNAMKKHLFGLFFIIEIIKISGGIGEIKLSINENKHKNILDFL